MPNACAPPSVSPHPHRTRRTTYHSKTSGVSTYGTPLLTIKTLTVAILANASSQSSLSQAATIATGLKAKGAVPKILGQFLASGVDATYSTAHAAPFDGIIVVDGTDDLFPKKASSATLYPPSRPTEIARDAFLFAKPIAAVGSGGKAALKAAKVDEKQDGILAVNPNDVSTIPDAFEKLLKQFKFLGRYALDS